MRQIFGKLMLLFLLIANFQFAFSQPVKPEPVRRIVYAQKPDEWYHQQAKLWQEQIKKNPQDASAWHNYYNAVRYEKFFDSANREKKEERLAQIVADLCQNVPNCWECYYLKYFNSGNDVKKIGDLEKAYAIDPTRPDVYYDFISYYEITGDEAKVTAFYKKLYASMDISPKLLDYNYNMLMSPDAEAEKIPSTEKILDFKFLEAAIQTELNEFDEMQRSTFLLKYQENFTIKEISQMLNCSEGTTKSRLFYTIKKLADRLKEFNPNFIEVQT